MKRILLLIFCFFQSLIIYSQYERINWIIFIDGKIPEKTVFNCELICYENSSKEKIINLEYTIGDIKILTEDLYYLKENDSLLRDQLIMKLFFTEFTKNSHNKYVYSVRIYPKLLFNDYVVLRLNNIDKKKGICYQAISTDDWSNPWYKEPYLFTKISLKINKKGVTNDTIFMKPKW